MNVLFPYSSISTGHAASLRASMPYLQLYVQKARTLSPNNLRISSERNFLEHRQIATFLSYLSAKLMLAEGGDRVSAHERRQAIWNKLCRCRHITVAELATEYQTSNATIRRDIAVLSMSYPIVTLRGNGGGIKLAEWYEPGMLQMTHAQIDLLLRVSKTLSGKDASIMRSIISQFSGPNRARIR